MGCEMCTAETGVANTTVVVQHPHGGGVQLAACDWCAASMRRLAAVTGGHAAFVIGAAAGVPPSGLPGAPRGSRAVALPALILELVEHVVDAAGVHYVVCIFGDERADGIWEGWLAFVGIGAAAVLRTGIETTQSTRADLAYWASGLEPTYIRGAFQRARRLSGS